MPKLSAALSKKVPIPGLEYSSQQFSCGLEMELTGDQTQDSIRQNIHKLYVLLHSAIDQEIQNAIANRPQFQNALQSSNAPHQGNDRDKSQTRWSGKSYGTTYPGRWNSPRSGNSRNYGGNGAGQAGRATQAQVKAIFAIAKGNGLERQELFELAREQFQVTQMEELSVRQASKFIETLKENNVRE